MVECSKLSPEKRQQLCKAHPSSKFYIWIDEYEIRNGVVFYCIEYGVQHPNKCELYHSWRRYSDIKRLYEILHAYDPRLQGVEFPGKYYFGNLLQFRIKARMVALNQFLSVFNTIPDIRSNLMFCNFFLNLSSRDENWSES